MVLLLCKTVLKRHLFYPLFSTFEHTIFSIRFVKDACSQFITEFTKYKSIPGDFNIVLIGILHFIIPHFKVSVVDKATF